MREKEPESWTETDWSWAKRQVSFIARMKGAAAKVFLDGKDPYFKVDSKGNKRKTRLLTSLLLWGHDPKGVV